MKRNTPRKHLLIFVLVTLFCVLAKPAAALAVETNLRIELYDDVTKERITPGPGDFSYAAHVQKVNEGSTSYEYDATHDYSYGHYHSKSFAISPNTYEALGWVVEGGSSSISIPHMLMDTSLFNGMRSGQYDVAIRVPSDYQGFGLGQLSLRDSPLVHNYDARPGTPGAPGTTAKVEKVNNEYVLKAYVKRRTTHSITFQIDNLQQLTSAGYSFKVKYEPSSDANQQFGSNAQTFTTTPSGNTLHFDVPWTQNRPQLGHYALVMVDPHAMDPNSAESTVSEFMLEPLRIPRVDPAKDTLPGWTVRYGLLFQPWSTWRNSVGADDANRMTQALDANHVAFRETNRVTNQMLDVENKWTRVKLVRGSATVTEVFPNEPEYYYVGHTLKVDLGLNTLTIQKKWFPSTNQPSEPVVVDYQADGGPTYSVTLKANDWSKVIAVPSNAAITFTEKNSEQNYMPAAWRLIGPTESDGAQTIVHLPTSQDGTVARLDVVRGTGVDGGECMPALDQKDAKRVLGTNASRLELSNQKAQTFNVEKKWEIDAEGKDKPVSITVALQERDDTAKKWVTVGQRELSAANDWKASLWVPYDQATGTFRVRELSSTNQTVWAETDLDAPPIKTALEGLDNWNQIWTQDTSGLANPQALLTFLTGQRISYVPTVVYNVGDHQTKYYAKYETDGNKTTITDTAVLDISIHKR
ncbi:MAG: hypothetical protein Q4A07_04635 [Coriobacteriales bacterium]|nr:hypothetical protein [Coriobacteriales bacterium]